MDLKDSKTKIRFYNGMRTIGGTYIEVSYEDARVIFDFGSEYHPDIKEDTDTLQEILDLGLVPYIDNMFDSSIKLHGYETKTSEFNETAVFLSHLHLDHSKMINYLDESIPLYTSKKTGKMLEVLNINEDFLYKSENPSVSGVRKNFGLDEGDMVQIGKLKIHILPVDHDAYGASALIIESPDRKIAYTGDIRLHGYRPEDTLKFCKAAKNADVLIIEGVSVSFRDFEDDLYEDEYESETSLLDAFNKLIDDNPKKQISFNYYVGNVERVEKIIETCSREVVLSSYSAYVLKELTGKNVKYYNTEDDRDYGLDPSLEVELEEIFEDEEKYLLQFDQNIHHYIDRFKKGGIYIHTDATPLGEFDPSYQPYVEMFKKSDISFKRMSSSGHAFPKDLLSIIKEVDAQLLVPIHSQKPEKLYNINGDRLLPERNQMI